MAFLNRVLFLILLFTCNLSYGTTLKEKIGQMIILGFQGKTIDAESPIIKAIDKNNLGGVILFDYDTPTKQYTRNIESPAQVKELNSQLQLMTGLANLIHQRENLPLLISIDYEGGKVTRLKNEYGFPATHSAKEVGEMPIEEVEPIAREMADTLKSLGFNLDFAPDLDIDNPNNPVIGKKERSFSNDPEKISQYAGVYSEQFINRKIQCAYKHFPGHGSSTADSHLGFVDVTESWHEQELLPYEQLLNQPKHCGMVMSAHIVNKKLDPSGMPATLSRTILTDILRHQLHFDGVIITDDMQMKAISDHYGLESAVTLTINAGADMLIFGNQLTDTPQDAEEIVNLIADQVAKGEISQERIDDAYRHIVHLKRTIGSLD